MWVSLGYTGPGGGQVGPWARGVEPGPGQPCGSGCGGWSRAADPVPRAVGQGWVRAGAARRGQREVRQGGQSAGAGRVGGGVAAKG